MQVDDSLGFAVSVFGCFLPDTHKVYNTFKRSVRNVNIIEVINSIETYDRCSGIPNVDPHGELMWHVIPKYYDPLLNEHTPLNSKQIRCHIRCEVLCRGDICTNKMPYKV